MLSEMLQRGWQYLVDNSTMQISQCKQCGFQKSPSTLASTSIGCLLKYLNIASQREKKNIVDSIKDKCYGVNVDYSYLKRRKGQRTRERIFKLNKSFTQLVEDVQDQKKYKFELLKKDVCSRAVSCVNCYLEDFRFFEDPRGWCVLRLRK